MNRDSSFQARPHRRPQARRGFTLVEMTLAAVIVAVVLGGLFSATMLASRVAETPYKRSTLDLHGLIDRIRQDAAIATAVQTLGTTAVTLTLPDRDGDGTADTVAYNWGQATATNGTITRTENGVAEAIPVRTSTFTVTSDIEETTSNDVSESSEQLLFSRTPLIPFTYAIRSAQWTGQYVVPALASNAVAWRVTRVRFPARYRGTTGGLTRVQVRTQSGGLPRTVVDESWLVESTLPFSFATQQISFSNAGNLSPASGVCIVFQWAADTDACELQYESLLSILSAGHRVTSTNSGATWSANGLQALSMQVYGTYSIPAGVTTRRLRALNVRVKNDSTMAAPITTTIRFNNRPVVPG